jgi:hypothetical protein
MSAAPSQTSFDFERDRQRHRDAEIRLTADESDPVDIGL